MLLNLPLHRNNQTIIQCVNWFVVVVNVALKFQNVFFHNLLWLLRFVAFHCCFKFDAEQSLDLVQLGVCFVYHFHVAICILFFAHFQRILETTQKLVVALLRVLLLMMALLVRFVKHREHLSHYLHKMIWREALALLVQIIEQVSGSVGQYHACFAGHATVAFIELVVFESHFEFVYSFEALHNTVHVARIPEVFQASRDHVPSFGYQGCRFFFRGHILNELHLFLRSFEFATLSSTHQLKRGFVLDTWICGPRSVILKNFTLGHNFLLINWNIRQRINLTFESRNIIGGVEFDIFKQLFSPFDVDCD